MDSSLRDHEIDRLGWGTYLYECRECGKRIVIVATVHSVEYGYAEALQDGQPICQVCTGMRKLSLN